MKIIPSISVCHNIDELNRLVSLICEYIHPELIILFGKYAGMQSTDIREGYELLILTKEVTAVSYQDLNTYLHTHFKIEDREEKNLMIHMFSLDFVRRISSISPFFLLARRQGILLYRKKDCKLKERIKYKGRKVSQCIKINTELALNLAKLFLNDAKQQHEVKNERIAGFYLYQSAIQLTRAVTYAYYGFIPQGVEDLQLTYSRIRYCTSELLELWGKDGDYESWRQLGRLQMMNYHARFSPQFKIDTILIKNCLAKIEAFVLATEAYCEKRSKELKTYS